MLGLKELLHFLPMGHITLISNVIDEWKSRKSKYTYSMNSPFKLNPHVCCVLLQSPSTKLLSIGLIAKPEA